MTNATFLAVIGHDTKRAAPWHSANKNIRSIGFGDQALILVDDGMRSQRSPHGVLLGSIFRKGETQSRDALNEREWEGILASHGTVLFERYWGNYVAIILDCNETRILRAPFGTMECYFAEQGGALFVTSDPAILSESGIVRHAVDWEQVAHHLARPELISEQTCLRGIRHLTGGSRLTRTDRHSVIETLWLPWPFIHGDADRAENVRRVRDTVNNCVAALASEHRHILLLLSGGLDSSIVSAALRNAGADFTCLTLVTEARSGDERHYARLAANAVDTRLVEVFRQVDGIDVRRSSAACAARPFARCFSQETERIASRIADEIDASAIFGGGGGDNLFYAHLSVSAAAEALLSRGPGRDFRATVHALADLSGESVLTVARRAVARACLRGNRPRMVSRTDFLAPVARELVGAHCRHPWYAPPAFVGPGKASHIAVMAAAQGLVEGGSPANRATWACPLVSQPVVEAVLGVPIWQWFAPGHNRAVARSAFASDLPASLINRRFKGTPNAFVNMALERNRSKIRDLLVGGRLAASGIVDRAAIEAALASDVPARDFGFARVMELVDVEAWARSWD